MVASSLDVAAGQVSTYLLVTFTVTAEQLLKVTDISLNWTYIRFVSV